MTQSTVAFHRRVTDALADHQLRVALDRTTNRFASSRLKGLASLPNVEHVRDQARAIRMRTLENLDKQLEQFEEAVGAAGGHVHWAKNATEASRIVLDLAKSRKVQRVVKSKSMISEEIELNKVLIDAGLNVIESDLGEYIIQLANEMPSHIIAPAVHKTKEEVGRLFAEKLGVPLTHDPEQMAKIARERLRNVFLRADMGISGVNFGVAETGTIAIVTNEGNASLTVSAPRIHVAMMGIERLVPTLDDLTVMLELLARSATGQKLTVYTDLLTGPRHDEQDGPEELHVVLLDNGRSGLLGTSMAEVLACIRCGACLNVCPVYREIGGHAYGSVYPGPIGAVLTPAIGGLERWEALPMASSLCGACRDACPVRIDLPRMLLELRAKRANANRLPLWLKFGLKLYAATATRPQLFRVMVSVSRWVLGKFSAGGWLRWLPSPLSGWTSSRDFPVFADQSFSEQWQSRRTNR